MSWLKRTKSQLFALAVSFVRGVQDGYTLLGLRLHPLMVRATPFAPNGVALFKVWYRDERIQVLIIDR